MSEIVRRVWGVVHVQLERHPADISYKYLDSQSHQNMKHTQPFNKTFLLHPSRVSIFANFAKLRIPNPALLLTSSHSLITTFLALTPSFCLSSPFCTLSNPSPTTNALGAGTNLSFLNPAGRNSPKSSSPPSAPSLQYRHFQSPQP